MRALALAVLLMPVAALAGEPVAVTVPAGSFVIGSRPAELAAEGIPDRMGMRELNGTRITFTQPFAMMPTPVTKGQFAAFAQATGLGDDQGCTRFDPGEGGFVVDPAMGRANPGFEQSDDHPVVCVSKGEAEAYAGWLSAQTGLNWRLPSEAEWEYAARAGSDGPRWFGDLENACDFANGFDQTRAETLGAMAGPGEPTACADGFAFTAPVGSFPANAFGIADQHGQLREWVDDCYADTHAGIPTDGSARVTDSCEKSVLKGVSFDYPPSHMRAQTRYRYAPDVRYPNVGFRLVHDLTDAR